MAKEKLIRLTINVPKELHMEIKKSAASEYKTMTRYILEAVLRKMHEEKIR